MGIMGKIDSFQPIIMILFVVWAFAASFFFTTPYIGYAFGVIILSSILHACINSALVQTSIAILTTYMLYGSGYLVIIPLMAFLLTNKHTAHYPIYILLEAMEAHPNIHNALKRIVDSDNDIKNALTISQLESDVVLGSAILCTSSKDNNTYGADHYIRCSGHMYTPSELYNSDYHKPVAK